MSPALWSSQQEFEQAINGTCAIKRGELAITDVKAFREKLIDELVWNAVFNENSDLKDTSRWIIWEAALVLGAIPASIHDLYMERAHNEYEWMTVPAINIRGLTYDVARTVFRSLIKNDAQAAIFEIARSEISYTNQRPAEYASTVLAAAIKENYAAPVFLQGDHFQINAKKYTAGPKEEIEAVKNLIREAIEAGFYNIDIDASTVVDLSKNTILDQQRANFEVTAEFTKFIRRLEPKGVTISIGGEIGEVGGKNSTIEELTAFMEGYNAVLNVKNRGRTVGISKISVQTGTAHGGVVLPDGSIAKVKLDFDTLEQLGRIAREQFHIGGAVQHGASTLPEGAFDHFPRRQTLEVHLATGFQNTIYDSPSLPKELKNEIYAWLDKTQAGEKKDGETQEQFYYKTRKKGLGPFKRELWSLPSDPRDAIMEELSKTFDMLFKKLGIVGSERLIEKYIRPNVVHKKGIMAP